MKDTQISRQEKEKLNRQEESVPYTPHEKNFYCSTKYQGEHTWEVTLVACRSIIV